jgi:hypothetical protein
MDFIIKIFPVREGLAYKLLQEKSKCKTIFLSISIQKQALKKEIENIFKRLVF